MKKHIFTAIKIILILSLVVSNVAFPYQQIYARSSSEIQQDIEQKQKDLQKTQNDLNKAKSDYEKYQAALNNSKGGLPALQAEIAKIDAEINLNNSQKALLDESKKLKQLQKDEKEASQEESLKDTYKDWRTKYQDDAIVSLIYQDEYDPKKVQKYSETIISSEQKKILGLATELEGLENNISDFDKTLAELSSKNAGLLAQKKKVEAEIAYYNSKVTSSSGSINNLQSKTKTLQGNISSLSQEQKLALQREAEILNSTGGNAVSIAGCGTFDNDNNNSNIYFCGLGRDNYQGHSVGLSQWGAHGMGKLNWDYQTIVKYYYTNIAITSGYESRNINVKFPDGHIQSMNIEDYVAGMGEVPSKACGTQQQVNSNPSKYVVDNLNNMWDCWPEETIKAFAVTFRSYALNYTNSGGAICTTAACQVYKGGNAARWAADETRGKAATYNGIVINALYSSDNNQGFGTSNNDTRFQGYNGNGTAVPFLRAVNDNAFATKTYYTTWGYKTKGYSMADINNLLNHVASNPGIYGGVSSYVNGLKSGIGNNAVSLSFERDPSKRVKKVWIKGANGVLQPLGGYWFKYIWNLWIYNNNIKKGDGNYDYIFSQTFFLHVN